MSVKYDECYTSCSTAVCMYICMCVCVCLCDCSDVLFEICSQRYRGSDSEVLFVDRPLSRCKKEQINQNQICLRRRLPRCSPARAALPSGSAASSSCCTSAPPPSNLGRHNSLLVIKIEPLET